MAWRQGRREKLHQEVGSSRCNDIRRNLDKFVKKFIAKMEVLGKVPETTLTIINKELL